MTDDSNRAPKNVVDAAETALVWAFDAAYETEWERVAEHEEGSAQTGGADRAATLAGIRAVLALANRRRPAFTGFEQSAIDALTPTTSDDIHWPLVDQALKGAATALPVLFTMCAKLGFREGATVADEIRANVLTAINQLAHAKRPPVTTREDHGA